MGDPRLLRQVFENLIGNAWKFTSKQPEARVEFGALAKDGEIVYFVKDNGAGFDPAYADRLFGVFQRLHSMTEFPGTGVGLAIVERIVRRHGGRIWADAAVGRARPSTSRWHHRRCVRPTPPETRTTARLGFARRRDGHGEGQPRAAANDLSG